MAATEGVSNCAFRLAERLAEEAELYRSILSLIVECCFYCIMFVDVYVIFSIFLYFISCCDDKGKFLYM